MLRVAFVMLVIFYIFIFNDLYLRLLIIISLPLARRVSESIQINVPRIAFRIFKMVLNFTIYSDTPFPLPKRFILIANHQSLLDIPILVYCFPHFSLRFAAKDMLFRFIPFISIMLRLKQHARIDRRGRIGRSLKSLERLARKTDKGIVPVIFPEGTRSRDGHVSRFKYGGIRKIIALRNLPIVVAALNGGHQNVTLMDLFRNLIGSTYKVKVVDIIYPTKSKGELENRLAEARSKIVDQVTTWQNAT